MPLVTRHSLTTIAVVVIATILAIGVFIWSGLYNVGADDAHTRPVHSLLQTLRERSIAVRAKELQAPDLADPARIRQGAGNYHAMCSGCHLAPGMAGTELSKGLSPAPPNLTRYSVDPRKAFWVIKHGIKASGMPAWGKSMEDEYIWNMAAFLQALPKLDAERYRALVASSGGHSHGGGESDGHSQDAAASDRRDEGTTHTHADGKQHMHGEKSETTSSKSASTAPTESAEEHADKDHQH